ncbi:MAG: glycosyltransferase family 4 protein [Candidatus Paceibacterota bacterium]|jgi:glycosyltransferase involved in cell wall biosynthesis
MKLIYLTSKRFPATTADHFFVKEMAKAFTKILSKDFLLVVADNTSDELKDISYKSLELKAIRRLGIRYFVWLPYFIWKDGLNNIDTLFFSNDANLLSILIFWKKVFGLKYKIVSDWHMLFENWRDRFVSKNSAKMITTTDHLKDLLVASSGVDNKDVLTAYGGVDLLKFDAVTESVSSLRNRLGLPVDAFIVGYIGFYKTMKMTKGLDTMINALSLIEDNNIKMVFVGGKPDEIEEYKLIAKNTGVADRIVFVPVVPADGMPAYEKAMDVLVIPYPDRPHFRKYGFPMKAYEYLASNRPVLYSNLPIMKEVLAGCAISFEPGSSQDLANKILELKSNPNKGSELVMNASKKVVSCTWLERAKNIVEFVRG